MFRSGFLILVSSMLAGGLWAGVDDAVDQRSLSLEMKPWTGDFSGMKERRVIRALVPFSRSLYFNDRGRERGSARNCSRFRTFINNKYRKDLGKRPITVVLIPTTRDRLLSGLVEEKATLRRGISRRPSNVGRLWIFAPDDGVTVREVLVTGPASPQCSYR